MTLDILILNLLIMRKVDENEQNIDVSNSATP